MTKLLRKKLLLALTVVAVLAGATTAVVVAAQPGSPSHKRAGTLASAASYLGVSETRLRSEVRSGRSLAQIADATPGRSAAGLVAAVEAADRARLASAAATLPARVRAEVDRVPGGEHTLLAAAASYLGVSRAQLRRELRSGKTLAQVAAASAGKSASGLVAALVAARKGNIEAEVKAGVITQARANVLLAKLNRRVNAQVQRARRTHG